MNRIVKVGVAALALGAVQSVHAQAEEVVVEESYGWTPIAFGLATPVQLPWGINKWDVFGLDLNVFYADAPLMYGWQIACANTVRRELRGIGTGVLFNYCGGDVRGVRVTVGANITRGDTYGLEIGSVGWHEFVKGVDIEVACCVQHEISGMNLSILGSFTGEQSYGATIGCVNFAPRAYGLQLGFAYNHTDELHGCQIGLVNYARECPWGFQIGLVNIILDNKIKVLPLVNCYF